MTKRVFVAMAFLVTEAVAQIASPAPAIKTSVCEILSSRDRFRDKTVELTGWIYPPFIDGELTLSDLKCQGRMVLEYAREDFKLMNEYLDDGYGMEATLMGVYKRSLIERRSIDFFVLRSITNIALKNSRTRDLGLLSDRITPVRQHEAPQRFEDFVVASKKKRRSRPAILKGRDGLSEPKTQFYRRVAKIARQGADFGGTFALVRWSCGSNCEKMLIADTKTGDPAPTPVLRVSGCVNHLNERVSYRTDSSLLIVTGAPEILGRTGDCGRYFFRWDRQGLELIQAIVPIDAPPAAH